MLLFKRYQYDPRTDLIGKGGFSRVYKAWDKKLNRQVALKIYRTNEATEKYSPIDEIRKVVGLDHPNISRYFDIDEIVNEDSFGQEEKIQVCVMELLDGGNLRAYYTQNKDLNVLKKLLIDVLQGLSFLHSNAIIHRDVKPANILVKKTANGPVAKITDFGISKKTDSLDTNTSSSSSLIVSIPYMAPEQLNVQKYAIEEKIHYNIDLWALGVTIYEIITDDVLFKNNIKDSSEQVMMNIIRDDIPEKINSLPEPFKEFVSKCVVRDAKGRVKTADELIPLLKEFPEKSVKDLPGTNDQGLGTSDNTGVSTPPKTKLKKQKSENKASQIVLKPDETIAVSAAWLESAAKLNNQQSINEKELDEGMEVSGLVSEPPRKQEVDSKLIVIEANELTGEKTLSKDFLNQPEEPNGTKAVMKETVEADEKLPENKIKQEERISIDSKTDLINFDTNKILIEPVELENQQQSKDFEVTDETRVVPADLLESFKNQPRGSQLDASKINKTKIKTAGIQIPVIQNEKVHSIDSEIIGEKTLMSTSQQTIDKVEEVNTRVADIENFQKTLAKQDPQEELEIKNEETDFILTDLMNETILITKSQLKINDLEQGILNTGENQNLLKDIAGPAELRQSLQSLQHDRDKDSTITLFNRYVYNPNKDLIGKGGFSRVYRATDQKLGRSVALKIYKTSEFSDRYSPIAEIKRVVNLDHPNICRYLDIEEIEKINPFGEVEKIQVCVMELLDSGNFLDYFNKNGKDLIVLKKLLQDILNGLSYLHKNGIIHRDIKPANILIKKNTEGPVAKITDFGISKDSDSINSNSSSALIVSIPYMTPEQLNINRYGISGQVSYNLDLWSLGVTIYEVITGNMLFKNSEHDSSEQIMTNIMSPELPEKIKELPQPFRDIVSHCIVKNANERAQKADELILMLNSTIAQTPKIIEDTISKIKPETEIERKEVMKPQKIKIEPKKPESTPLQKKFSIAEPAPVIEKRAKKRINSLRISIVVAGVLLAVASIFFVMNVKKNTTMKEERVIQQPVDNKNIDTITNTVKKDSILDSKKDNSFQQTTAKIPVPKKELIIKEKINVAIIKGDKIEANENIKDVEKNTTKSSASKVKYTLIINADQPCSITKNGSNVGSINGRSLQVYLVPGQYNITGTTEDGKVSSKTIFVTDLQAGKSGNLRINF